MKKELKEKIYEFSGKISEIALNYKSDFAQKNKLMAKEYKKLEKWIYENYVDNGLF